MEKRLGSYTTLLAGLEDNNRTDQIVANVYWYTLSATWRH